VVAPRLDPGISYFGIPSPSQPVLPSAPETAAMPDPSQLTLGTINKIAIPFTIWAARNPGALAKVASDPAAAAIAASHLGASSAFDAAQEAVTPTPGGTVDQLMGLARYLMQQRQ
jgi:hypothetical protein